MEQQQQEHNLHLPHHPYNHHHHHHQHQHQSETVGGGGGDGDGELMIGPEEWMHDQLDLENHIRHCQCSCNHMGFGNYWSYKVTVN